MTTRRKASTGPAPMLHDLRVTLASDARIDTLLEQAEVADEKLDTLSFEVSKLGEQGAESRLRVETVLAEVAVLQDQNLDMLRLLRRILSLEKQEMVKLADLQEAQAQTAAVQAQAVELMQQQHDRLDELTKNLEAAVDNGSDEEIQAVIDGLKASRESLKAGIDAASSNAPAPAPEPAPEPVPDEPAPVDPAPEPAPEEPAPAPEPDPDAPTA